MAPDIKTMRVPADSDSAVLLARAADTPIVVETDGKRYRVTREDDDLWADYDPEAVQAALDRVFGILAGVDAEALKAELRAQRDQPGPLLSGAPDSAVYRLAAIRAISMPSATGASRYR